MSRRWSRSTARLTAAGCCVLGWAVAFSGTPAVAALPATDAPVLSLVRTIRTAPFAGSAVSMKDNEGSAYVARDNSLWLADDDGRALREVNATTGALIRSIDKKAFEAAPQYGVGTPAGAYRFRDLESLAYDEAHDIMYAFSGSCCSDAAQPTVFRLVRSGTKLQLESFQPLPPGSDNTASAWSPADQSIYVGHGKEIRSYAYTSNTFGGPIQVTGLTGIFGMDFTAGGADLFVTTSATKLLRVDWPTKTLVPSWTFDLNPFGVMDARAVELVGDRLYVSDGYDGRPVGDPLAHAVYVFDVHSATQPPTASFNATPTTGDAPLTVQFSDTSSGDVTGRAWDFGDGSTSTEQNPSHVYSEPGTFTVTLTATNANGSSTASRTVEVTAPPASDTNLIGNPHFETGLEGWDTNGVTAVTLEQASGGHSGSWSVKVTNTGASPVSATLNDSPNSVSKTSAGTYTASIWVRSATAGTKVYLRVREYQGTTKLNEAIVPVQLTTTWQQVTATMTPTAPGASSIDFAAVMFSAPPGASYFVDDASLTLG